MEEGIKNCPFCGSKDISVIDRIDYRDALRTHYHLRCKGCGVKTDEYDSQFEAIVAWNRRV